MAIIPLKQISTVHKKGAPDLDGYPTDLGSFDYKCRIDEGSFRVKTANGEQAVARARILYEGLIDINYEDLVAYTNELGKKIERHPMDIAVKRDIGSKPIFTEVKV